jgi:hypothetical protein
MRRFISKQHIVLYFLFLLLLTTSCSPKLDEKITAYQEAHNSGDVEKEMSFFAEDIKYEVIGQWKVTDKEHLKKLAETDVVLNSHLIFTDIKSSKNKVTCKVEEENDLLKISGIDKLYYEFREFIFEDGLIKEVKTQPTQEGADALRNSHGAFGRWAAENRKEEFDELRSAAVITKDNIGKWLALMREWREESEKEKEKEEEEQ